MSETRVYVFDLDGVLYRGETVVEHAAETLERLRSRRPAPSLFFLTNNSTQTRQTYADKLTRLGMPCSAEEIVTSASATADYIAHTLHATSAKVLVVGGPGLVAELAGVGLKAVHSRDPEAPGERFDFVTVGLDRHFEYGSLYRAQQAILNGATFIATNRDGQYPMEGGQVIPGGGSMVAAIQASTDITPTVIGKPETLGLQTILDRANANPDEAVMVGDRLDTDILCGNRLGVPSVLVLTGVTSQTRADQLIAEDPRMRPGRTISDLREL